MRSLWGVPTIVARRPSHRTSPDPARARLEALPRASRGMAIAASATATPWVEGRLNHLLLRRPGPPIAGIRYPPLGDSSDRTGHRRRRREELAGSGAHFTTCSQLTSESLGDPRVEGRSPEHVSPVRSSFCSPTTQSLPYTLSRARRVSSPGPPSRKSDPEPPTNLSLPWFPVR